MMRSKHKTHSQMANTLTLQQHKHPVFGRSIMEEKREVIWHIDTEKKNKLSKDQVIKTTKTGILV